MLKGQDCIGGRENRKLSIGQRLYVRGPSVKGKVPGPGWTQMPSDTLGNRDFLVPR